MSMGKTITIAILTIEENIRKKIIYLFFFFAFLLIVFSSAFTAFNLGSQSIIMKDISLSGINLIGILFTLSLFLNVIPREIETKTIYPFIAQPITRADYIWGKFIGLTTIIAANLIALGLLLIIVVHPYEGFYNFSIMKAVFLIVIQCGIIGAVMLCCSLFMSYPLALTSTLFVYAIGITSTPYIASLAGNLPQLLIKFIILIKLILPKLDIFAIKNAVVHGHQLLPGYMMSSCFYGVVYIAVIMMLTTVLFESKDL